MSTCMTCARTRGLLTQMQGEFVRTVRRAAGNPSARNLAAVERSRTERDKVRDDYAKHLQGWHSETGEAS